MKCHCGCKQESFDKYFLSGHGSKNIPKLTKEQRITAYKKMRDLHPNLLRENGKKSAEMNRKNGVGFFKKDFHKNNLANCRKGGESFVLRYGGWSGLHKNLKEKNSERYYQILKKGGKKAGRMMISKYGGWAFVNHSENGKKVSEFNRINKIGFFSEEMKIIRKINGKKLLEFNRKNNLRPGCKKVEKFGLTFDSKGECECASLLNKSGMPLIERETVHYIIGTREIDFRIKNILGIKDGTFLEYHPIAQRNDNRTPEEYYNDRRKILNDSEFLNEDLIVVSNITEMENILNGKKN